jgi:hypothetical protein
VAGNLAGVMAVMKGTPTTYNKDTQVRCAWLPIRKNKSIGAGGLRRHPAAQFVGPRRRLSHVKSIRELNSLPPTVLRFF